MLNGGKTARVGGGGGSPVTGHDGASSSLSPIKTRPLSSSVARHVRASRGDDAAAYPTHSAVAAAGACQCRPASTTSAGGRSGGARASCCSRSRLPRSRSSATAWTRGAGGGRALRGRGGQEGGRRGGGGEKREEEEAAKRRGRRPPRRSRASWRVPRGSRRRPPKPRGGQGGGRAQAPQGPERETQVRAGSGAVRGTAGGADDGADGVAPGAPCEVCARFGAHRGGAEGDGGQAPGDAAVTASGPAARPSVRLRGSRATSAWASSATRFWRRGASRGRWRWASRPPRRTTRRARTRWCARSRRRRRAMFRGRPGDAPPATLQRLSLMVHPDKHRGKLSGRPARRFARSRRRATTSTCSPSAPRREGARGDVTRHAPGHLGARGARDAVVSAGGSVAVFLCGVIHTNYVGVRIAFAATDSPHAFVSRARTRHSSSTNGPVSSPSMGSRSAASAAATAVSRRRRQTPPGSARPPEQRLDPFPDPARDVSRGRVLRDVRGPVHGGFQPRRHRGGGLPRRPRRRRPPPAPAPPPPAFAPRLPPSSSAIVDAGTPPPRLLRRVLDGDQAPLHPHLLLVILAERTKPAAKTRLSCACRRSSSSARGGEERFAARASPARARLASSPPPAPAARGGHAEHSGRHAAAPPRLRLYLYFCLRHRLRRRLRRPLRDRWAGRTRGLEGSAPEVATRRLFPARLVASRPARPASLRRAPPPRARDRGTCAAARRRARPGTSRAGGVDQRPGGGARTAPRRRRRILRQPRRRRARPRPARGPLSGPARARAGVHLARLRRARARSRSASSPSHRRSRSRDRASWRSRASRSSRSASRRHRSRRRAAGVAAGFSGRPRRGDAPAGGGAATRVARGDERAPRDPQLHGRVQIVLRPRFASVPLIVLVPPTPRGGGNDAIVAARTPSCHRPTRRLSSPTLRPPRSRCPRRRRQQSGAVHSGSRSTARFSRVGEVTRLAGDAETRDGPYGAQ